MWVEPGRDIFALCDITTDRHMKLPLSYLCYLLLEIFLTRPNCNLCPFSAGNDVKEVFASARSSDQYRVLKIIIEDGNETS